MPLCIFFFLICSTKELTIKQSALEKFKSNILTCGSPVNETGFDHLNGISKRKEHPPFPEPEVAFIFKKNEFDDPDLDVIEANLVEAVKQVSFLTIIILVHIAYIDVSAFRN